MVKHYNVLDSIVVPLPKETILKWWFEVKNAPPTVIRITTRPSGDFNSLADPGSLSSMRGNPWWASAENLPSLDLGRSAC